MLDLRLIRRDPDAVRAALARRGDVSRLDEVLDLDEDWRAATASAERLRAEQKAASDSIGAAKRAGEDAGPLLERMRDMSA
jgi:seryl-tRNA synthetase